MTEPERFPRGWLSEPEPERFPLRSPATTVDDVTMRFRLLLLVMALATTACTSTDSVETVNVEADNSRVAEQSGVPAPLGAAARLAAAGELAAEGGTFSFIIRDDEDTEFAGQYSVSDGLTYVLDAESMGFGSGNDIRVVMNGDGVFVLGALSAFLSKVPDDAWIRQDNDVLAAEIKTLFDFLAGGLASIVDDENAEVVELGVSDLGTRYGPHMGSG